MPVVRDSVLTPTPPSYERGVNERLREDIDNLIEQFYAIADDPGIEVYDAPTLNVSEARSAAFTEAAEMLTSLPTQTA